MNTYADKMHENNNHSDKEHAPVKTFSDNRSASIQMQKLQGELNNKDSVVQLGKKGSHGKHLHFKVTTIQITNNVTNAVRYVNANYDEDLGKIPTHGQGPARRTQADADLIAANTVVLAPNETITDINWDHFSQ